MHKWTKLEDLVSWLWQQCLEDRNEEIDLAMKLRQLADRIDPPNYKSPY